MGSISANQIESDTTEVNLLSTSLLNQLSNTGISHPTDNFFSYDLYLEKLICETGDTILTEDFDFFVTEESDTKPIYGLLQIKKDTITDFSNNNWIGDRDFSFTLFFQPITIRPNSIIIVELTIPYRHDASAELKWKGAYTDFLYRIDGGTWISLGNSGHDGPMHESSSISRIMTYSRTFSLQPSSAPTDSIYEIQFAVRSRSYDLHSSGGVALYINNAHDLNRTGSGGDTYQNATLEPLTHFHSNIIVFEYNDLRIYGQINS